MVDFTREEVEAAIEEYASTLIEEEEDEFIDDEEAVSYTHLTLPTNREV